MTYERVKQAVQELALENMNLYPLQWDVDLQDAKEMIRWLAESYFENRTEEEVRREKRT